MINFQNTVIENMTIYNIEEPMAAAQLPDLSLIADKLKFLQMAITLILEQHVGQDEAAGVNALFHDLQNEINLTDAAGKL